MKRIVLLLIIAIGVLTNVDCSNKSPTSSSSSTATPTKTPENTATPTSTPVLTYPFKAAWGQTTGSPVVGTYSDYTTPAGVAVSPDGKYIAVSDPGYPNIEIFNQRTGTYLYEMDYTNNNNTGANGPGDPNGMTFDSSDNLYVADASDAQGLPEVDVYAITASAGTWIGAFDGGGAFTGPMDVKFDNNGNFLVADNSGSMGSVYNIDFNTQNTIAQNTGDNNSIVPTGLAADSAGNIYVADQNSDYVVVYDSGLHCQGSFNGVLPYWPTGTLGIPQAIVVDKEGTLIISDVNTGVVLRTTINGVFIEQIGSGNIGVPEYMGLDKTGDLYVVDSSNLALLEFTSQ